MDEIDFLKSAWEGAERGAIKANANVLDHVQKRVTALETEVAHQKEDILQLRAQVKGLTTLLQRTLDLKELDQEVKLALELFAPPVAVAKAKRGADPSAPAVNSDDAKRLMKTAQDHHFAKQFAEARVIYQQIVDEFAGTKQATVAMQQLENLAGQ